MQRLDCKCFITPRDHFNPTQKQLQIILSTFWQHQLNFTYLPIHNRTSEHHPSGEIKNVISDISEIVPLNQRVQTHCSLRKSTFKYNIDFLSDRRKIQSWKIDKCLQFSILMKWTIRLHHYCILFAPLAGFKSDVQKKQSDYVWRTEPGFIRSYQRILHLLFILL